MNAPFRLFLFATGFSALLPSCSLSPNSVPQTVSLKDGVRYEVRSALSASAPLHASLMQPRFFTYSATPELGGGSQLAAAEPLAPNSNLRVRTTAYCHDESDHIAYGQLTALGTRLKYGAVRSAAADWSRFPVGTLFRIKDQPQILYQVDDYGSALVGTSTIDLYQPTRGLMNEWGVRHVDIEVLRWGSFARSQAIIRDRTRYPHVRRMFDDLSRRMYEVASAPTSSASATPYAAL